MLYFKYSIVTLFSLSLLFILTGYLRLLRFYYAAKKMQEVRHKLLKQIVLRFTNCCRLNIAICNTGVFVKKYIADYSVAGFHYHTFLLLSNLFTALGIGVNFAGVFLFQAVFIPMCLFGSVLYPVSFCLWFIRSVQPVRQMCHTGYGLSRQYTQTPSVHGRKQCITGRTCR